MLLLTICSCGLIYGFTLPPLVKVILATWLDGGQWEVEHNVKSVALFCWANQMSLAWSLLKMVTLYVVPGQEYS